MFPFIQIILNDSSLFLNLLMAFKSVDHLPKIIKSPSSSSMSNRIIAVYMPTI